MTLVWGPFKLPFMLRTLSIESIPTGWSSWLLSDEQSIEAGQLGSSKHLGRVPERLPVMCTDNF